MKRKEGFTIVELIIVIAVIGVLAAILIPTFANVIEKANAKSALADARNMLTAYLAEQVENDLMKESIVIFVEKADQYYVFGYATGEGKLQISSGNPFKYDNLADLIAAENTTQNPASATDGSFYLVPSGTNPYNLKGAPKVKGVEEDYVPVVLNDAPEGAETFWGALVAGTFDMDNGDDEPSSTDEPGETSDPNPPVGDDKYALSVMVVPEGAATAVINPTTEEAYDAGAEVALSFTQTPAQAEQYTFIRYSVSGTEISTATTCNVTMNANKAVVINFAAGAWDGTEDTSDTYGGGSGTESDPYVISTPQQLYHLALKVNAGTTYSGNYFVLANDIVLNDGTMSSTSTEALPWTPIGSSSKAFQGSFNGQGYAVSGIYINNTGSYLGLFGHVYNGTVSNVVTTNSYIAGAQYVGGISGFARNSTFNQCASFASISATTGRCGGIVGSNYASNSNRGILTITKCINGGSVNGGSGVGGILGYDSCGGEISECVNMGAISGTTVVGGIAGYVRGGIDNAEYSSCYNMGAISGTGDYVGGIMGQIYNLAYVSGTKCYNAGTVASSGSTKYGAFMGGGSGASYISNLSNNYDLDTACDQGSGTTPVSEADLKALPAALGDKYMLDNTPNINNGFPILVWQSTGNITEPVVGGGNDNIPVTYTLMYMDGTRLVASEAHKENDHVTVRGALADKEGFKFTEWKNGSNSHRPGSSFTMPASDYVMNADWLSIPAGEYYYELRYVVGAGSNYTIITSTTGTATEGAVIAYDASVLSGEYASFSIIEPESPFVIQNNNNNLFLVYCAQGISTAEQFDAIRNGLGGTYALLNDIDLSSFASWNAIGHTSGSNGNQFTGTLNGNGHTISGVNIPTSSYSGLIFDNNGTIENLYVVANNCTSAGSTGILVCQNSADGTISKCGVSGTITILSGGNYAYTGGIAAYNMGTIDQCWSNVSITATGSSQYYNGCLTGYCSGTISNCIAFGSIYGARSAGITGYADGCTLEYTYSICKIDAPSGETWTKHSWGEAGSINPGRGIYNQKGLVYRAGATSTQWDTYTGDSYANHQYAYGQALTGLDAEGQWTVERFTTNGYSTDIWNLADGQYPTLKNNPVRDGLTVAPPVAPILP